MNENEPAPSQALVIKERQDFAGRESQAIVETASSAAAAQAKAAVESRYVMALRRPRDWDDVRATLLKECRRPSFASVARYHKPVGNGIEGPSIRFAEAAIRCMGNAMPESYVVYDDDERRIVRVSVTDLEANVTYTRDVTIEKTVERRQPKPGDTVLRSRQNKNGQTVYLIAATEDDLLNKESAQISKAMRTCALRIVPGDILDECMETVKRVQHDETARDPDAEKKRACDAFLGLGIKPSSLKDYLGHPIEQATTDELVKLRALYAALRDGETSWTAAVEAAAAERPATEKQATSAGQTSTAALAAKLGGGNGQKAPEVAPATVSTPPEAPPAAPTSPAPTPRQEAGEHTAVDTVDRRAETQPPQGQADLGLRPGSSAAAPKARPEPDPRRDAHPDWPAPTCPECGDAGKVARPLKASKFGDWECSGPQHPAEIRFFRASDAEREKVAELRGRLNVEEDEILMSALADAGVQADVRTWMVGHAAKAIQLAQEVLSSRPRGQQTEHGVDDAPHPAEEG